jgi:transcriptional antiterminator RfaH
MRHPSSKEFLMADFHQRGGVHVLGGEPGSARIETLDDANRSRVEVDAEQEPVRFWTDSCGSRDAWFCAEPHYGQTERAIEELGNQSFVTFNPKVWELRSKGNRLKRVEVPMFPGYLFVRFDPTLVRRVLNTRGVRSLIVAMGRPARVPDRLLLLVKDHAAELGAEFEEAASKVIRPGTKLRITDGVWAGYHGECILHETVRITVMMSIFGRETKVEFATQDVAVVPEGVEAQAQPMWRKR